MLAEVDQILAALSKFTGWCPANQSARHFRGSDRQLPRKCRAFFPSWVELVALVCYNTPAFKLKTIFGDRKMALSSGK